ncbi:snRNA-activating protein complex subunit 1 isoform X2 [Struthio camelus]|uniref:snRNA-activating protein complex subunit 1 isoform X2 n=1 Tax=Struthio camelus TaxID=8801 RepID=UPI003603FA4E
MRRGDPEVEGEAGCSCACGAVAAVRDVRGGGGMCSVPGLKADCEALLGAFQEADTVRFERFAELWRERGFHAIFYGRIRALERNKLTKKTLDLAQQYFLPPYAFQIRVGALYLLYGLYSVQLCQPKQKIRIALKDWPEVQRFQQDLIESQHYDAVYIFRKLRVARAFHFTAMPKLLNYRTQKKVQENEFKEEFKDPSNRVNSLITNDVLEELMNIHDHYQKMKCVISTDKSQPDKALSLIKDEFVVSLKDMTLEHQEWQQKRMKFLNAKEADEIPNRKEEETSLASEGSERANALAKIKYRSYSAVVEASKSRRHRQVKLESSDSGSEYGKSQSRSKKNSKRPQAARNRDSAEIQGEMRMTEEAVTRHVGMPIITEEGTSDEEEVPLLKRKKRR